MGNIGRYNSVERQNHFNDTKMSDDIKIYESDSKIVRKYNEKKDLFASLIPNTAREMDVTR